MRTVMEEETEKEYLNQLCEEVRSLIHDYHIEESREKICEAMKDYPDAAEPHNLFGILMEKQGVPYISDEAFPRGLVIGSHIPARKKKHR